MVSAVQRDTAGGEYKLDVFYQDTGGKYDEEVSFCCEVLDKCIVSLSIMC